MKLLAWMLLFFITSITASDFISLIDSGTVDPVVHVDIDTLDMQACYVFADKASGFCTPYAPPVYCIFKDGVPDNCSATQI